MSKVREIVNDGRVYGRYVPFEAHDSGLTFYSTEEENLQVGVWFGYPRGKRVQAHYHNEYARTANLTQEVFFVVRGSVRTNIYDDRLRVIDSLVLNTGDIYIHLFGGHDFEILEEGTIVYEAKNGPVDIPRDKTKFSGAP